MIKALALSPDNRVFRHWADPGANCIQGVSVAVYAEGETAAVTVGMCVAGYTDSAKLRELAAGIMTAADRIEKER